MCALWFCGSWILDGRIARRGGWPPRAMSAQTGCIVSVQIETTCARLRTSNGLEFLQVRRPQRLQKARRFSPFGADFMKVIQRQTEWRRVRDSNPRYGFPYAGFQDRCHQPLGQLSASMPKHDLSIVYQRSPHFLRNIVSAYDPQRIIAQTPSRFLHSQKRHTPPSRISRYS
jgi:hypothetical protein